MAVGNTVWPSKHFPVKVGPSKISYYSVSLRGSHLLFNCLSNVFQSSGIDVLHKHRKLTLVAVCEVSLCEMLDQQYRLPQLLSTPCVQESSWVLKRNVFTRRNQGALQPKDTIGMFDATMTNMQFDNPTLRSPMKLRARVNRSVWVAGSVGYVEVYLMLENIKRVSQHRSTPCRLSYLRSVLIVVKITAVKLVLQQKVRTYRCGDAGKTTVRYEHAKIVAESLYRGKSALSGLTGPPINDWRMATLRIAIPVSEHGRLSMLLDRWRREGFEAYKTRLGSA
jgi:hypothetical protein